MQQPPALPPLFLAAVRDSAVFRRASARLSNAPAALSLAELAELCDPSRNALFDPRDRRVYMDMTRPLSDYFMSSSHNTYIGGNQLYGKASVRAIARSIARRTKPRRFSRCTRELGRPGVRWRSGCAPCSAPCSRSVPRPPPPLTEPEPEPEPESPLAARSR